MRNGEYEHSRPQARRLFAWFVLMGLLAGTVTAREPLRVGITVSPPMVVDHSTSGSLIDSTGSGQSQQSGSRPYDGIAVSLWQDIADAEGIEFQWNVIQSDDPASLLIRDEVDVLLTVIPQADQVDKIAYTQPYLTTHLAAMSRTGTNSLWSYAVALLNQQFWRTVMWLSALLLVVGAICWLLERGANAEMFRRRPLPGVWDGFYWAGVTMTTIGYGDKAPATFWGRALALIWMLIAIAVTSTLTASIVSVVRKTDASTQIKSLPADVRGKQIAVVAGDYAQTYVQQQGLEATEKDSIQAAVKALQNKEVDIVLGMRAALAAAKQSAPSSASATSLSKLKITNTRLKPQGYTIAVAADQTELLARLNRQVLLHTRDSDWDAMVDRFLKSDLDR